MECQKMNEQTIYPVFYDVDPSEVRKQHGPVGEALAKHKNESKVGKWKEALREAANMSGWDLRKTADGHEAKVIRLIVERVSLELRSINMNVDENLIGMKQRLESLESYLEMGLNDVRMIGIKGMGGAGKTTLARAIFDRISIQFEAKSFVENVREVSKGSLSGLLSLQRQILSYLSKYQDNNVSGVHDGKNMMKRKLCGKKVLVILDDVDHKDQLEALAGEANWFMLGSRIIITTRDEQVLMLEYVLTERLKTIPLKETLEKLELSYISLEDDYKEMFLDIACFLKGWDKDKAIRLLLSCGFHAKTGIRVLEQKSLIMTSKAFDTEFLHIHDHLEEMGKNIVRRLHPDEPNRHSRLWIQEEIEDVLANDLGTESTKCIIMKLTPEIVVEGLGNMKKLRCLIVDYRNYNNDFVKNVKIDEASQYLPKTLRYFNWFCYPHWCLPKTFGADNLVALEMHASKIEQLWEGGKVLKKLIILELRYSKLRTLDLGLIPNLERLDLEGCYNLSELTVPVGCLKGLNYLNLRWCIRLTSFSFIKQLGSLEFLNLGYLSLWKFPDIIPGHSNNSLLELDFSSNYIEELPSLIGNLHKLVCLKLSGCKKLQYLPESIFRLRRLRNLHLDNCAIKVFPNADRGQLECLNILDLSNTNITQLPDSISLLKHLKTLLLRRCALLEKLPDDLSRLESLEELDLSCNSKIEDIPSSICKLKHLKTLILEEYEVLKLPDDLSELKSLKKLSLRGSKIRDVPDIICNLKHLQELDLFGCSELEKLPENLGELECLKMLDIQGTSVSYIPHSVSLLKDLVILDSFVERIDPNRHLSREQQ